MPKGIYNRNAARKLVDTDKPQVTAPRRRTRTPARSRRNRPIEVESFIEAIVQRVLHTLALRIK